VKRLSWMLGTIVLAGSCWAQQTAPQPAVASAAVVSFEFDRPGLPVPHFVLAIHEDGSGTYQADEEERRSADSALQLVSRKHIERGLNVSQGMVEKIFKSARMLNRFNMVCASKAKNIADTGKKTFTYSGADGSGTCTYNYSEDKSVATLGDTFFAIANTMDIGRKLEFERRFDRLGLDAELISLEHAVEEKDALELGSISSILNVIASDGDLMQRARLRAAKLLQQAADAK
jgi:hypothetical protein